MEWNKLEDRCHCHQVQIPYFWYLPCFNLENYQFIIKNQTININSFSNNQQKILCESIQWYIAILPASIPGHTLPRPTHPFFKSEGILKIKKRGWKYGQEQVFLKRGEGGWHFSYLIFSSFIVFTFRNCFTLYKF